MNGKYSRTTNVSFLRPHFSVLKFDGYLKLLVTDKYEKGIFHTNEAIRQLYMEAVVLNFVNMLEKAKAVLVNERR